MCHPCVSALCPFFTAEEGGRHYLVERTPPFPYLRPRPHPLPPASFPLQAFPWAVDATSAGSSITLTITANGGCNPAYGCCSVALEKIEIVINGEFERPRAPNPDPPALPLRGGKAGSRSLDLRIQVSGSPGSKTRNHCPWRPLHLSPEL